MEAQKTSAPAKTGRKPVADKKVACSIYRRKSEYAKLGGAGAAREIMNKAIDQAIKKQHKTN